VPFSNAAYGARECKDGTGYATHDAWMGHTVRMRYNVTHHVGDRCEDHEVVDVEDGQGHADANLGSEVGDAHKVERVCSAHTWAKHNTCQMRSWLAMNTEQAVVARVTYLTTAEAG